jgi:2-methylcitrate dehydratase PrpD
MSEQRHRPPNPSEPIASFVSTLSFEEIPEDAVRLAERCFVDTVGVTLAGAQTGAGAAAAAIADPGETTVLGRDEAASMSDAALANGTAGHGLDFDDVSWGMDGHPSVALVAPALAVGERLDATGRELVTAFVAGFETECAIAAPISPSHYGRGWHPFSSRPSSLFATPGGRSVESADPRWRRRRGRVEIRSRDSVEPFGTEKNSGTAALGSDQANN